MYLSKTYFALSEQESKLQALHALNLSKVSCSICHSDEMIDTKFKKSFAFINFNLNRLI